MLSSRLVLLRSFWFFLFSATTDCDGCQVFLPFMVLNSLKKKKTNYCFIFSFICRSEAVITAYIEVLDPLITRHLPHHCWQDSSPSGISGSIFRRSIQTSNAALKWRNVKRVRHSWASTVTEINTTFMWLLGENWVFTQICAAWFWRRHHKTSKFNWAS